MNLELMYIDVVEWFKLRKKFWKMKCFVVWLVILILMFVVFLVFMIIIFYSMFGGNFDLLKNGKGVWKVVKEERFSIIF